MAERFDTAVVGAGAAGLLAACRLGPGTVVLEEAPKPGKKLLQTGNGRCNLTNLDIRPERYHGDVARASALLCAWPGDRVRAEFADLGLLTRVDGEGRVYPNSLQAAAVLRALWSAAQRRGIALRCGFAVCSVTRERDGFFLCAQTGERIFARRVLLACGGRASAKNRGGYGLARALGHSVTELRPSLVPLKSDRRCRALKGQRCRAGAALYHNGKAVHRESGEVLFGDGQLSGICVLNCSARVDAGEGWELGLDLLEDLGPDEVLAYLRARAARDPGGDLLAGAVNLRVGQELCREGGGLEEIARRAKDWRFPILGLGSWEQAQVTRGGVPLEEIDLQTMESKCCPGLYLCGELLHLDGDCGGYNLHWAWITGLTAGRALAGRNGYAESF